MKVSKEDGQNNDQKMDWKDWKLYLSAAIYADYALPRHLALLGVLGKS